MKQNNTNLLQQPLRLNLPRQSPSTINIDLPFKINTQTLPSLSITSPHNKPTTQDRPIKDVEQDSTVELLMTERTINEMTTTLPHNKQILSKSSNIKSYLRIKPYKQQNYIPLDIYNNQTIIIDRSIYKFDNIFEPQTPQAKIYQIVGKEVTNNFIQGYNGTIFAYGSTGSGKTYTMFGNDDGIVPSVVEEIFSKLNLNAFKLSCSMIEIYKQNLIDLLCENDVDLKIKEINNTLSIQNLSIHEIRNKQQTYSIIKKGNILKKIRQTNLNQSSSRSHVVFTFYLQKIDLQNRPIRCKFNLVDLAGSEKVCKSKVEGQGLQQAIKINLSLSCLGNTIQALVKNSQHIPYRQSKLTRILKESLMGNSITRLIVTCCITQQSMQETISSIKFAQRAQKIQTQAEISYNISKLKNNKEENNRHIKLQLQSLSSQVNSIKSLIKTQPSCQNCQSIKTILQNTTLTSPQLTYQQLILNPTIKALKSPQSQSRSTNLTNYFSSSSNTNNNHHSTSKYSSINRKQYSKNHNNNHNFIKINNYYKEDQTQSKETFNKKIYELKTQNNKLKQMKIGLQLRITQLQEKLNEKQLSRNQKGNKKIIRLNISEKNQNNKNNVNAIVAMNNLNSGNGREINGERVGRSNHREYHNLENNKENNGNAINLQRVSYKTIQENCTKDHNNTNLQLHNHKPTKLNNKDKHQEQFNSKTAIIDNSSNSDMTNALQLIGQLILKLESSTKQYRSTIFPFQLEILNNQIALLQQTIIQQKTPSSSPSPSSIFISNNSFLHDPSKPFRLIIQLQKKLCYYIDQLPLIIQKLFDLSQSPNDLKQQLFQSLKNKIKEISDIKWNIKELYDQSQQLNELTNLLQRSKNISFIKEKEKSCNQSICQENQFLMLSYANIQQLEKNC